MLKVKRFYHECDADGNISACTHRVGYNIEFQIHKCQPKEVEDKTKQAKVRIAVSNYEQHEKMHVYMSVGLCGAMPTIIILCLLIISH